MQPQLRHRRGRAVVRGAARLPLGGRGLPARRERPQVSGRTTLTSSGPSYAAVDAMATRAMTLSQLPPKILPAASANGLAELASARTGMMPMMATLATTYTMVVTSVPMIVDRGIVRLGS